MIHQPDNLLRDTARLNSSTASPSHSAMLNAFTVDVEDYYQVSAFEDKIPRSQWSDYPSRVVRNTLRLLDLLDQYGTRGTFFVLGWTARRFPDLIEEIHYRGHELGSHSFWHRLVYSQSPAEFRQDLRDSVKAIEDASGTVVTSYRAPSFSITKRSEWALEILREEGIDVDSSIYPIYHDRYGMPDSEPGIHVRETRSGNVVEVPPTVLQTRIGNLPVSGGGYFRLYPGMLTRTCIKHVHRREYPYVFYIHPWEIDPDQPRLPSSSRVKTWRHRVNLDSTYGKLENLLRQFRFGTVNDLVAKFRPTEHAPPRFRTASHHRLLPR